MKKAKLESQIVTVDLTRMDLPTHILEYLKYRHQTATPKKFIQCGQRVSPPLLVDNETIIKIANAIQNDIATLQATKISLLSRLEKKLR